MFTAEQIKHWDCETDTVHGWKLARPIGRGGIVRRLRMAWVVFTGKGDVLMWHGQ
jgi:hypothetical protein